VKKLVDDCVSSQQLASLRPHDAVSALGPMYDVHDKSHLPRIEACDHELQNLLKHCKKSKNKMNLYVHTSLQNVAALQSNIRDMRNQLALFKEAMARQDEIFQELKKVRRVGPSYKACLAEVVRRRECMKLYMGQAGLLAEKLARKREIEVGHREEFLRIQSMYMPRDVLQAMGLFELPSQCVVNIAPFDTHLLDIDISDLERYAPESLVGRLPKLALGADANMRGGNSRSLSDSGFQSGGGSEGSRDAGDGGKLEGNEEIEGDEIAGTSKLEVENAWLKSEFASAVAMLWNLDLDFELEEGEGDSQDPENAGEVQRLAKAHSAALKTADALRLKDEHAKHLHAMLAMWQVCDLFMSFQVPFMSINERERKQGLRIHPQGHMHCFCWVGYSSSDIMVLCYTTGKMWVL
jgi:autophagy-related protein 11